MTLHLSVEDATLHRGGRLLFEGMNLQLRAGEALHVHGPNGSGKSSLIRMVAGLLRPQAGTVERSPSALADDSLALDRDLPLRRALHFWARLSGSSGRCDAALEAMGLSDLADVPVRLLSSGQAKRAALARVIGSGAPLWLLDEPLNGLDSASVARLDMAVAAHLAGGGAVLAASHGPLGGEWLRLDLAA